jgi:hypothetical protein
MALINYYLHLFDFEYIEDVTESSLKKAFKKSILNVHPDKGGTSEDFDKILSGYTYLSHIIECINSGKSTLKDMSSLEELKEKRSDEVINKLFDELQIDSFNTLFESSDNKNIYNASSKRGYGQLFKSGSSSEREDINIDNIINDKGYTDFNDAFININKKQKDIIDTLIIHPDELAVISGPLIGTSIIEQNGGNFTSELNSHPEYSDVYSAYTTDNVIYDKLNTTYKEYSSVEELINERSAIIPPLTANEIEKFEIYKKEKEEEQRKHKESIKNFYNGLVSGEILCYEDRNLDVTFGNMVIEIKPPKV